MNHAMSEQLPITIRTRHIVRAIFPSEHWDDVERALMEDCGPVQVHAPQFDADPMERIWLAALKVSRGDVSPDISHRVMIWRFGTLARSFGGDAVSRDARPRRDGAFSSFAGRAPPFPSGGWLSQRLSACALSGSSAPRGSS